MAYSKLSRGTPESVTHSVTVFAHKIELCLTANDIALQHMDRYFEAELRNHYDLRVISGISSDKTEVIESGYKVYLQPSIRLEGPILELSLPWQLFCIKKGELEAFLLIKEIDINSRSNKEYINWCIYDAENDYINLENPLDPYRTIIY